ncbi:hypothetical protein evm_000935 [Chilo suppressalis]|nr:hypothetical protein evm_000935 [Chilo suppressalis]
MGGKNDEPASDKFLENGDCFNASKTVESEGPEKERKSDKQALETSVDKEECFNISKTGENEDHKKGGKSDKQASDKNIESEDHLNGKLGFLNTFDIDWLYNYVREKKNKEARCVKLRAQQEAREYRKMTKGVDNVRMRFPEDSISYQLKQMNRQLIAIGQFIISIFAGFLFGFRGVEWMVGNLDFGFRLLLGVMCALIIALAEIYFLAKKLNEELNVPETTQLGGPPTFADERFNGNKIGKHNKPHQD